MVGHSASFELGRSDLEDCYTLDHSRQLEVRGETKALVSLSPNSQHVQGLESSLKTMQLQWLEYDCLARPLCNSASHLTSEGVPYSYLAETRPCQVCW